jgi:isocitrate dehydrogenase kinase/phosphatase
VQSLTEKAVEFLRELLPERGLNESFMAIILEGTDKKFDVAHNREWLKHTRPILEAFAHARYMVEMALRYAELPEPPQPMPSGWAGLLYLYDLR